MKNIKMKSSFVLALTLLLTVVLSACGNSSDSSADGKVTISFLHWRGEDTQAFQKIIDQFEAKNPNIKVDMQTLTSDQYQSTAQAKLTDGSVGDVFASFPGAQYAALSKAGLYTDLTNESFLKNYNADLIDVGAKDGKQWAVPYQLVYNQPIYNTEIFKKYNLTPPTDWDGFLKLCATLKQNGIIPIAFAGADIGPGQLMNTMVMNNEPSEDIFTKVEAGQAKLTDEFWVKTLTQFKELNDNGYFQDNSLGTKDAAAGALFIQGKAAMLASGSYQLAQNAKQNPELKQALLAPITVSADQAKYEGVHTSTFMLGVNSRSKHQAEAKKFLEFLSQPDVASQYANETGQNVTLKDITYDSPELKIAGDWADKKTIFQPRFTILNSENQKAVTNSIQSVLGGATPEQAAQDAQAIVDQQIK
ncbi:raffinose/stachyose/melibiose transport system substrate-binding protein [Paenibacillus sp. SORGH_AS306]|uniref:Extracellular solute-binding protein n=1 Tax=Paenibacillus kyungheensis TaxID=1452732 RepID=A0AAX3M8U9_9BACL|nr:MULTISPECIES: extracellular solute-binding protein [Paenibacillus]MDQ1234018.1 raffinose/stachyose/melibiose transport system substrate-binding protein [Paenibacillus sp. SORGH_AS_0306]MDR6111062.1 raffinose/stachyose/melibiose transport system substrate-binding protein [Paenibacillus sp. SORGH_AS_0338]WCT57914.1 extracellular solute-binding protein [Paenibacillus kyungheensis]